MRVIGYKGLWISYGNQLHIKFHIVSYQFHIISFLYKFHDDVYDKDVMVYNDDVSFNILILIVTITIVIIKMRTLLIRLHYFTITMLILTMGLYHEDVNLSSFSRVFFRRTMHFVIRRMRCFIAMTAAKAVKGPTRTTVAKARSQKSGHARRKQRRRQRATRRQRDGHARRQGGQRASSPSGSSGSVRARQQKLKLELIYCKDKKLQLSEFVNLFQNLIQETWKRTPNTYILPQSVFPRLAK